jgi:alkyl sulfatase BDS1-like metallo-beta-lactamase superfamily hydrolase
LELEGKINPGKVVQARMRALQSKMTGEEILTSWRYQVDADKAAATRLSLGIQFTDSSDGYWLQLRNSVLEIRPQQAPKDTPTVSLSVQQLRSLIAGEQTNVQGDADVLAELMALLDLEQESFSMHLR